MTRINWPPKLSDNDLAIIEVKRKLLEYKFKDDKPVVTHKPFDEVVPTETLIRDLFDLDNQKMKIKQTRILGNITNKTSALAYLREQKLYRDEHR